MSVDDNKPRPITSRAAIIFTLGFFVLSAVTIVLGRRYFDLSGSDIDAIFVGLSNSPWGLPVTIAVFCTAAFIGAPQWMLISAAVLAFSPIQGGLYAWAATLTSASLDFWLARYLGAERLEKVSGGVLRKVTKAIRKNGFVTSLVVRLVPTGPFILVNFAAGLSNMRFRAFFGGTALGIIPKIAVVVLIGLGVISGIDKSYMAIIFAALAVLIAFAVYLAQNRLKL